MKTSSSFFVLTVLLISFVVIGESYCQMHVGKLVGFFDEIFPADSSFYLTADKMPEPVGGIEAITKNVVYPNLAKQAGIQGKVFVTALVDEKGNVIETKILKGIGSGCDEAASKAISSVKFTPGIKDGKAVKVKITIPVMFKLSDKDKQEAIEQNKKHEKKIKEAFEKDVYLSVDKMPEPVGGIEAIMSKIVYPKEAKEAGIQGKVFVAALIDESGNVAEASVQKGIGSGCDEAALAAIKTTKFTPGVLNNKNVKVKVFIPVMFKLQ
jgi:TonB family protein